MCVLGVEEGTTGILPLMVMDQAILHSIDKFTVVSVLCVGWGGEGVDEEGHHRCLASDGGGPGHSAQHRQV